MARVDSIHLSFRKVVHQDKLKITILKNSQVDLKVEN